MAERMSMTNSRQVALLGKLHGPTAKWKLHDLWFYLKAKISGPTVKRPFALRSAMTSSKEVTPRTSKQRKLDDTREERKLYDHKLCGNSSCNDLCPN